MYKSPIEVISFHDAVVNAMKQQYKAVENDVYTAVLNVGVNVDKGELVKALKYDRDQYLAGYADGAQALADKVIEESSEIARRGYSLSAGLMIDIIKQIAADMAN